MAMLDFKVLLAERKLKVTLLITVVTYVLVFQLLYNTFWGPSSSKRFLFSDGALWLNFWKSGPDATNGSELHAVHVHGEDHSLRYAGERIEEHETHERSGRASIAIGGGITSKHLDSSAADHIAETFQFFKTFLPSFCQTASPGYDYHFYLAYDATDALFKDVAFLTAFQKAFFAKTSKLCSHLGTVALHLVECSHAGKPAWAQNDAMMEAYLDNVDYHYRINDDTVMTTANWTRAFIEALDTFDPPKIGVVGPNHSGGNTAILTYDFVHRTHVDIFGYYYPRLFTDWFADGWITRTYRPDRCKKLPDILLVHTLGLGQRYSVAEGRGNLQAPRVAADKVILNRYVSYIGTKDSVKTDGKKVIAMSLFGRDPKYSWGAIRNAQLAPIFFPGWTLRIYVPHEAEETSSFNLTAPQRILTKLKQLGAELSYVKTKSIPPVFWRYLVVDDSGIDYFIVRNADGRLSERDAVAVNNWLQHLDSNVSLNALHCIRDHPSHASLSIVDGLWGGRRAAIRGVLNKDMLVLLESFYSTQNLSSSDSLDQQQVGISSQKSTSSSVLSDILWPLLSSTAYCHDSVSCDRWPDARKFPVQRNGDEYLGRKFDQHQEPVKMDGKLLRRLGNRCTEENRSLTADALKST